MKMDVRFLSGFIKKFSLWFGYEIGENGCAEFVLG